MAFSDPSSGFFSPVTPSIGGDAPNVRQFSIPDVQNFNSPRAQPFEITRPVNYEPDATGGVIAKGIAQTLDNATTAADSVLKIGINDAARKGVADILNKQIQAGLDTKQDLLQDQDDSKTGGAKDAPTGFSQGLSKLDTIDKAARSGAMSNTQFYASAQDLVAGLKQKYPGYSSVVDEKIKSIIGTDPAEGIRASLQRDIDTLRKAQADKLDAVDKYLLTNQGDLPQGWQNGNRMEMLGVVQKAQAFRNKASDDALVRQTKVNQGLDASEDALQSFSWQYTNKAADVFNAWQKSVEKQTGKTLDQLIAGDIPIKDRDFVNSSLKTMQSSLYNTGNNILTQSNLPGSDPSHSIFASLARAGKGDQADKIMKQFDPFQRLIDATTSGDWATFKSEARTVNAIKDGRTAEIYANNPDFLNQSIILKDLPPSVLAQVTSSAPLAKLMADVTTNAYTLLNAKGGTPWSDGAKSHDNSYRQENQGKAPTSWGEQISMKTGILGAPDGDPKKVEQHFRDVYLDKDPTYFINQVMKGDSGMSGAMDVFNKFTNPAITKNVQNQPDDIKNGYQTWAKQNFARLSNRLGDDINANATSSPYYDVTYDKAVGQFVTVPTELGKQRPGLYAQSVNNFTSLNKLNSGLLSMKPIVEMNGGSMDNYVSQILPGLLLDPSQLKKDESSKAFQTEKNRNNYNKQGSFSTIEGDAPKQASKPLLDLIGKGESSGSYDSLFGVKDAKISSMSLDEVLGKQKELIKGGAESTAAGKYQFINKTLQGLKDEMGLKGTEKMTPELQDQLGQKLLERRGYNDFKSGKISKYDFVNNLSQEWAALPNMTGKGHYDGIGSNKSNVNLVDLLSTLDNL